MSTGGESAEARIIAAALRQLRRDGARRLAVVRVAEEAGMTHANVYRYFRSKRDLTDRILGDWLREIELRLADISQAPDPADDKLERFLTHLSRSYFDKSGQDPRIFELLIAGRLEERPVARRHSQRVRDLLARIVEEGLATRLFAGGDLRRTGQLVDDVMHRFIDPVALPRSGSEPAHFDARRDRVIRLLIRALAAGRSVT